MARFMIHWCAPDPTNEKYTQAIVDYIKGGKPMDEYAGFKVLARQIHPHLGGGCLLVEADNLVKVQKHTYPWTKGLGQPALSGDLRPSRRINVAKVVAFIGHDYSFKSNAMFCTDASTWRRWRRRFSAFSTS